MRQGILNFPYFSIQLKYFSIQLKTAEHKYLNVMEALLSPEDATIPPNEHAVIRTQSQIYAENAVTGILQPSHLSHAEGDVTFGAAIVTLNEVTMGIRVNNITGQPYKLKKGLHIAYFSVMTPEQMKHVRPIDSMSTWHLLNENEVDAIHSISSLLKANRNNDQDKKYWFPRENLKTQETKRLIHPYRNEYSRNCAAYEKQKKLNPNDDEESRRKFLNNFAWKDSMQQQQEIKEIESLLVDFHDIFARHRFNIGINEEFSVKLAAMYDSPAYSQTLPTPGNLKEDILVELASLHKYGIGTTLPTSKYASSIFAQKNPTGNSDYWLT